MDVTLHQAITALQLVIAAAVVLMIAFELWSGRTAIRPVAFRDREASRYWRAIGLHALIAGAILYMAVE